MMREKNTRNMSKEEPKGTRREGHEKMGVEQRGREILVLSHSHHKSSLPFISMI